MLRFLGRRLGVLGLLGGYFLHPRLGARRRARALALARRGRTALRSRAGRPLRG